MVVFLNSGISAVFSDKTCFVCQ